MKLILESEINISHIVYTNDNHKKKKFLRLMDPGRYHSKV